MRKTKTSRKKGWIHGIGFMDIEGYVSQKFEIIDGKRKMVWICPVYRAWKGMFDRCYHEKYHSRHTYEGCSVCDEWKLFSNFLNWTLTQDWEGKSLDKDLLVEGNKVYSPDTCLYVHQKINSFIIDATSARGKYMLGVYWNKPRSKFMAQCNDPFTGEREYLGLFTDELEAHLAWKARKHQHACALADSEYCNDDRLREVLRTKYLNDFTSK